MREYIIICDMYLPNGGSYKYATNPKSEFYRYSRGERQEFISHVKRIKKEDMIYENIKLFFIDYSIPSIATLSIKDVEELDKGV